jgi:hypothetical protein
VDGPYPHTFKHKQKDYEAVSIEFLSGTVDSAPTEKLLKFLSALGSNASYDDAVQCRDQIQATAINNILMQRHIKGIEARSNRTARIVVFLAISSVAASAIQIYLAL